MTKRKFPEDVKAYAEQMNALMKKFSELKHEKDFFSQGLDKESKQIESDYPWCTQMKHIYRSYTYQFNYDRMQESVEFAAEYNRYADDKLIEPTEPDCTDYVNSIPHPNTLSSYDDMIF